MRARNRFTVRNAASSPELGLTSMVDVVFLLLIFFVVSFKSADIVGSLHVARASKGPGGMQSSIHIRVAEDGYTVEGRPMSLISIGENLRKMKDLNEEQPVAISCAPESSHAGLVELLDACSRHGFRNIAFSNR